MSQLYRRTVEDASNMLAYAKQKESDLISVSQSFYYPSLTDGIEATDNLKLMDVDEEFIQMLEEGERFVFKGSDQEKVVLCSDNKTYEVKEGEISNMLVVCPDLLYVSDLKALHSDERSLKDQKVCGVFYSYLELRETFPRLNKLRKFLACTEYRGPKEDEETHKGFYLSELLDNIQCSKNELLTSLKEIKALCYEDKWRVVGIEYETRVLSYIISLMEENNWEKIHRSDTKHILKSLVPEFIIDYVLMYFAKPDEENEDLYDFKEDKVSQSFAEMLLRTAEGKFRHNEFVMAWEQCLPQSIKPSLSHLRGLALVEKEGTQQEVIHLFPEYNLPESIPERFRLLFKRKEKWTLDEITPYVEKLATKTMNVNMMLTKYARVSNLKGTRVFTARYAN